MRNSYPYMHRRWIWLRREWGWWWLLLPKVVLDATFFLSIPNHFKIFSPYFSFRQTKNKKALKNFPAYIFNFSIWILVCSVKWFFLAQSRNETKKKRYENYFTEERRVHIIISMRGNLLQNYRKSTVGFGCRCLMLMQNFKGRVFFSPFGICCDVCDASTHKWMNIKTIEKQINKKQNEKTILFHKISILRFTQWTRLWLFDHSFISLAKKNRKTLFSIFISWVRTWALV